MGAFVVFCLVDFTRRCLRYTGADFSVPSALLAASPLLLAAMVIPFVLRKRLLGVSARAVFVVEMVLETGVGVSLLVLSPDSLVLLSSGLVAVALVALASAARSLIRVLQPE